MVGMVGEHKSQIKFPKTCTKSNCICKSCYAFNKSTTKVRMRSYIDRETSIMSSMHNMQKIDVLK